MGGPATGGLFLGPALPGWVTFFDQAEADRLGGHRDLSSSGKRARLLVLTQPPEKHTQGGRTGFDLNDSGLAPGPNSHNAIY